MTTDWTELGPYVAGEIPEPWIHQFLDADGVAIDLTGYTVRLVYKLDNGDQVVRTGALPAPAAGQAGYTWVEADFATAGLMQGELVVGNGGTNRRLARSFRCRINAPLGGTLPDI